MAQKAISDAKSVSFADVAGVVASVFGLDWDCLLGLVTKAIANAGGGATSTLILTKIVMSIGKYLEDADSENSSDQDWKSIKKIVDDSGRKVATEADKAGKPGKGQKAASSALAKAAVATTAPIKALVPDDKAQGADACDYCALEMYKYQSKPDGGGT